MSAALGATPLLSTECSWWLWVGPGPLLHLPFYTSAMPSSQRHGSTCQPADVKGMCKEGRTADTAFPDMALAERDLTRQLAAYTIRARGSSSAGR